MQMKYVFGSALLLLSVTLIGCDSTDVVTADPEIIALRIQPDSASMPVGETLDFSFVGLTATGDTVQNADVDVRWWSSDPAVFTVDETGTAVGHEEGTAYCVVELTDLSKAAASFTGRDSAFVFVF
jgi:hypothetical protein